MGEKKSSKKRTKVETPVTSMEADFDPKKLKWSEEKPTPGKGEKVLRLRKDNKLMYAVMPAKEYFTLIAMATAASQDTAHYIAKKMGQ